MRLTFDPAKHGVSLALAAQLEWGSAVVWPDQRHEYFEHRRVGLGYVDNRLFAVVFVDRGGTRRIIFFPQEGKSLIDSF